MNDRKFQMENIAIIGLGLIGGSIAKALRKSTFKIKIAAFDDNDIIKLALEEKVIDQKLNSIEEAAEYDFIILSLPIDLSLKFFKKLIPLIKKDAIISDVCSVKGPFEKEWQGAESKGFYIGGHPMTGKEVGGFKNSDPLLFENAVYIISDKAKETKRISDFLQFVNLIGARGIYLDPFLHDDVVANVSHLPQLISVALLNSVSSNNGTINYLNFAAGGFRDLNRNGSRNLDIWKYINEINKKNIISSNDNFQKNLNRIKKRVEEEEFETLRSNFEKAKINRESIPENKKGFIHPLFDLFIFINDEPGILYKITKTLSEKNINIKDIELQKIRENVGGTFRLSFYSINELDEAKIILKKSGFSIYN